MKLIAKPEPMEWTVKPESGFAFFPTRINPTTKVWFERYTRYKIYHGFQWMIYDPVSGDQYTSIIDRWESVGIYHPFGRQWNVEQNPTDPKNNNEITLPKKRNKIKRAKMKKSKLVIKKSVNKGRYGFIEREIQ